MLNLSKNIKSESDNCCKELRSIVDWLPVGFLMIDVEGVVRYKNASFDILFEQAYNSIEGVPLNILKEKENVFEVISRLISENKSIIDKKVKVILPNKEEKYIKFCVNITNLGKDQKFFITFQDLSNEYILEKTLEDNLLKYSAIFNDAPDVILLADTADGTIVDCNETACSLFGLEKSQLIGKNQSELMSKEYTETSIDIFFDAVKDLKTGIKSAPFELAFNSINNIPVPHSGKAQLLYIGDKEYIQGIFREISKQKSIEEENRYRLKIEEAIAYISRKFLKSGNEYFEDSIKKSLKAITHLLGYDRCEMNISQDNYQNQVFHYIFDSEFRKLTFDMQTLIPEIKWMINKLTHNKLMIVSDTESLPESDQLIKYKCLENDVKSFMAAPLIINNKNFGYIAFLVTNKIKFWTPNDINLIKIIADIISSAVIRKTNEDENEKLISELQQTQNVLEVNAMELKAKHEQLLASREELSKVNETKDKFFSIIAHDLRGPMGSLFKLMNLLQSEYNDLRDDERLEIINAVHSTGKGAYQLLENLLEWSRSQSNRIAFIPKRIDISAAVYRSVEQYYSTAENKMIKIDYNLSNSIYVNADSKMLDTILRNLISNAVKFSPAKSRILITVKKDTDFAFVNIIDNGVGISENDQRRLFRIDSGFTMLGTENEKGTGLGLILCKEFVEKHGGTISVQSEPGKGSVFSFSIPLFQL